MCLFEKEESNIFPQGGTYDQYHRWIGNRPDFIGVCSLDPFLVWRSRANRQTPTQERRPDQDQREGARDATPFRALRGDRLSRRPFRLCYQRGTYPGSVLPETSALCRTFHGPV